MKYFDAFSGYGGFSLGIKQAYEELSDRSANRRQSKIRREEMELDENSSDIASKSGEQVPTCIGYSEIDKYAIQVYNKHFNHKNYGSITDIVAKELPAFDLLCGGFPCQAFSIAGKRAGFEDTRGTLIYDVFRIIKEKHPRFVLLENVKGLLSHDSGNTFKTILTSLAELGYDVEWQVLNAKNFGVPQNRERVFIIGHLGGFGGRKVFPLGGTAGKDIKVVADLNSKTWKKRNESIRRVYSPNGVAPTTPTGTGGGVMTKISTKNSLCSLGRNTCALYAFSSLTNSGAK